MNITISRVDMDLPLPEYHTSGAVGFDLVARVTTVIPANSFAIVPNNVIVSIPHGYMLLVASRSSTLKKKGLMIGNGVGIIDQDYHGPEDELKTLFFNPSNTDIVVERGERWSQAVFVRIDVATFHEEDASNRATRGGFGTTGERVA